MTVEQAFSINLFGTRLWFIETDYLNLLLKFNLRKVYTNKFSLFRSICFKLTGFKSSNF
jgi:hypothetical protein